MSWTLVTGGSRGLGAAICRGLAAAGRPVLVHYRRGRDEALRIVDECRCCGVDAAPLFGDFATLETTHAFIKSCLENYPEIDCLINNVGEYLLKPLAMTTGEEWHQLFQTNLLAPHIITQALLPSLKATHGAVINIGIAGNHQVRADKNRPAFLTTKIALWMETKCLARELAREGVRVNMVSPGYLENSIDLPSADRLPMGKPESFDAVLSVIRFLLDPQNRTVTGQNIEVAGAIGLIH